MYTFFMTQMITGLQFWNEVDMARGKNTIAWLAEASGVPQSLLFSARQRQNFLSFENTLLVCSSLSIDLNSFISCDNRENDRLVHPVNLGTPNVGRQFWAILDLILSYRGWSWRYVALRCNIPTTTISSAKSDARTLSFDVTLKMLEGMDLTPDALAKNIMLTKHPPLDPIEQKSEIELKRERLIRTIKRLDVAELDNIIEYVDFIRSKKK